MKEDWIYKRGDLYYANLNPYFGSEQGGTRPVLVLQNNVGNFFCPTLIVAPLTSKWIKKKELPTHYALESVPELGLKSVVLLEQIKTIDKRRVLSYIGRVSREEMRAIDDALQVSLWRCRRFRGLDSRRGCAIYWRGRLLFTHRFRMGKPCHL